MTRCAAKPMAFTIADNRICNQCGARAGQCEHLEAEPYQRLVNHNVDNRDSRVLRWHERDKETLERMWRSNSTSCEIADHLNMSRNAVKSQIWRMGLTGKQGEPA